MAQIPASGFAVAFRGSGSRLRLGVTGAGILLLLTTSWVDAQSAAPGNSIPKNKPTTSAVSPVPPQELAPPPVVPPPPPPTPEQQPPQPPVVAWDGKQLTIDAENSTLSDILVAVRERTGASIEIPGAASGERVFVHLGPGSARDIISSLVYGTSFDYIVETAEDDPDTLRRVVLTAQGQGDSSGEVVAAGAAETGEGSSGGAALATDGYRGRATEPLAHPERVRMMPGWSSPGKPTSQAEAEAAFASQQAAAQEAAAPADAAESAPNAQNPGAGSAESQVANSNSQSSSPAAASPASSITESDLPPATAEDSSAASASNSNDQSGVGQSIQNMTRMFEQRRQIQAQQNQPPPSSN